MKYSMQPVLFKEPLKDFLDVFGNLDFFGFNNVTKFGYYRRQLMEKNLNPRVFMCPYARKNMDWYECDLFQMSFTNRGFGYTFNQADFWDHYISTWYTKEFSEIYRPKSFKKSDNHLDEKQGWRKSKDNIFYPIQSGPKDVIRSI